MVMKPDPIFAAVEEVLGEDLKEIPILLLSPQGRVLTHELAQFYADRERIALICGRYEGVDERVRQHLVTDEISIGDYVLTGGELPALVFIDAVTRFIPGVLGDESAPHQDSHSDGLLEHPHYTRPMIFRGWEVPEILRSGDHARIAAWRREQALRRTYERRPDLFEEATLTSEEQGQIQAWKGDRSEANQKPNHPSTEHGPILSTKENKS